ncbi:MAG: hypothetical protein ABIA04_05080 [Pseudomonadota bacterium]
MPGAQNKSSNQKIITPDNNTFYTSSYKIKTPTGSIFNVLILLGIVTSLIILPFSSCLETGSPDRTPGQGTIQDTTVTEEDDNLTIDENIATTEDIEAAVQAEIEEITSPVAIPVPGSNEEDNYLLTLDGIIPSADIIQRSDISQLDIISRNDLITRNDITSDDVASSIMKSSLKKSTASAYGFILVLINIDDSGNLHVDAEFTEDDYSFSFGFETIPDGVFQLSLYVKYENDESDLVLYHVADFFDANSNSLFAFNGTSFDFGTPVMDGTKLITPSDTSFLAQDDLLEAPDLTTASRNIERVTFIIGRDDNEISLTGYSPSGNPISVYVTNAPVFFDISATDDSTDSSVVTIDLDSSAAVEGIYPISLIVKDNTTGISTSHTPIIYVIEENQISTTPDDFVFESTIDDMTSYDIGLPNLVTYGTNYNKAFFAYTSNVGTYWTTETRWGAFSSSAVQVSRNTYRDSDYDATWSLEGIGEIDSDGTNFATISISDGCIVIIRIIDSSFQLVSRKTFNRDDYEGVSSFGSADISINKYGKGIAGFISDDGYIRLVYIDTNTGEISNDYILDSAAINHTVDGYLQLVLTNSNLLVIRNGTIASGRAFILADYENSSLTNYRTTVADNVNGEDGYYYESFSRLFTVYGDLGKDIAAYTYPSGGKIRILLFTSEGEKRSSGGNLIQTIDGEDIEIGGAWVHRSGPISATGDPYGRVVIGWGVLTDGDDTSYALLATADGKIYSDDKFIVERIDGNGGIDTCMLNDGKFAITHTSDDGVKFKVYNNSQ